MRFKYWLFIQESIDADTEKALVPFMAKFSPEQKAEAEKELQAFRDSPDLVAKGQVFSALQKFIQKKEKPTSQEDAFRKNWQDRGSTEEELKTYDFFKDEPKQSLTEMMDLLRKFIDKKLITIQFENNKPVLMRNTLQGQQKLDTPDFTRFMSHLHGIESSLTQYSGKGNYFNPIEEELNHQPNLVAKGDNVWVFKGHAPDICRIYGKNQKWCISSSRSAANWFGYRMDHHQTQYFVFDFNKDEDDPARYVNPGVAPDGMYSEWVDANNQHEEDPEDTNSQVGINGYRSIREYKEYLASKGIPLDIWKTTPPEEWEERLYSYQEGEYFSGAKNDPDPRVFPMYLKIVDKLDDKDFDSLDDNQKTEFVMGKLDYLTDKQFEYAKNVKGYYNSLQIDDKIKFAVKTNDQDKLKNFAKNPELSDSNVYWLLEIAPDKDKQEIAKLIIANKKELSDNNVFNLLNYASDKQEIAKLIIQYKEELSEDNVFNLLHYASDKQEIAEKLGPKNINKLFQRNMILLLNYASKKQEVAEILGSERISNFNYDNVKNLLKYTSDKKEIAQIIDQYHTEKTPEIQELIKPYL